MTDKPEPPPHFSPIDFLRTKSLTNVVQAEIERMIVDRMLKPGDRVNENALAQQLGVSRGPIREACSALTAMGLVEVIPHRGFFIRKLNEEEAAELGEARACVFAYIGRLLAERIKDAEIAQLCEIVDRMAQVEAAGEPDVYYAINLEFHDAIITMCGNVRLARMYRGFVRELHIHRYRGLQATHEALSEAEHRGMVKDLIAASNEEHRAMRDALIARDPDRAYETFHSHIVNGLARNLLVRHTDAGLLPVPRETGERISRRS